MGGLLGANGSRERPRFGCGKSRFLSRRKPPDGGSGEPAPALGEKQKRFRSHANASVCRPSNVGDNLELGLDHGLRRQAGRYRIRMAMHEPPRTVFKAKDARDA